MTENFDDAIKIGLKREQEKQLFGGNLYEMAHKLPTIYITKNIKESVDGIQNTYNLESLINYTRVVRDISDSCGRDLALLFAELYKLYEIGIDNILPNPQNMFINTMITDFCTEAIALLSLALSQSEKLLEILNSDKDRNNLEIEITGNNYCFIVIILKNLFYYYSTIVNFITSKRYLNSDFISSISERLAFIVSNEFESIRRMFKVVECYKAIESTTTFH